MTTEENLETVEEEETLNLEPEVKEEEQEEVEAPEPKTYTEEEVSKMKADSERGVQKLFKEQEELNAIIETVGKVSADQSYLVQYYDENPKVAKIILDKYYGGQSIEEFKKDI